MLLPAEVVILILVIFLIGRWLFGLVKDKNTDDKFADLEALVRNLTNDLQRQVDDVTQRVDDLDDDTDVIDQRIDAARIPDVAQPRSKRRRERVKTPRL